MPPCYVCGDVGKEKVGGKWLCQACFKDWKFYRDWYGIYYPVEYLFNSWLNLAVEEEDGPSV